MKKTLLFLMVLSALVLSLASCALLQKWCKHQYEDTVVDPSCTAQGYTDHTCKKCGYSYQDTTTQKFAHLYKSVVTSPTCLEEGYTTHTCTECGDTYQDTVTRKLPHDYDTETFPATCSSEGYTKYTCSYCNHTYNDNVTAITSHRFNNSPCKYCGMEEITENIIPDIEWYNADSIVFTVKTAGQLAGLASLVNEGLVTSDQIFYLDADIDLGFYEWIPIGTAEHPFNATLKGEGYTISSLKISADHDYVGLFGNVTGKVDNLNVMNASVYVKNPFSYVGIFAGYVKNEINSVNVSGYVDAKLSSYVGGIAGYAEAQIQKSSSATEVSGYDYVGGIAGAAASGSAIYSHITFIGSVTGNDYVGCIAGAATPGSSIYSHITINGSVTGNNYVGGMIGHLSTSSSVQTDNITSTANVSGVTYVGGILGFATTKTDSKLYNVSVRAEITGDYYVGGLIGKTTNLTIDNCTNEGSTVIANSYITEEDAFYVYLGGYVGYGYIVTNCTNTVDISYNSRGAYIGGIAGYLTNAISKCENSASIFGKDSVGGLVGKLETNSAITVSDLKNTGNVSGARNIGGIIGYFTVNAKVNITLSKLENSGIIYASSNDAAGIVGCYNNGGNMEHTLNAADLKNTGDVTAEYKTVGGLFGYVGAANGSSIIKNSTSSANITGPYHIGGLVGLTNIAISNCSNEGSTITATSWYTEGSTDYVWLGGYVGSGYKVTGCTNNSDITYSGTGIYVGGIIGYATGEIQDCTNNGDISSTGAHVGGIVGYALAVGDVTYKNLTNTGVINANGYTGGAFGSLIQNENREGTRNDINVHQHYFTVTLNNISNSGNIESSGGNVGGIIGYCYLNNTASRTQTSCCGYYYVYHTHRGDSKLSADSITNIAEISGAMNVGEFIGCFYSDTGSTLNQYTVTGSITINGELLEGNYDVGTNTNLTLSERELYVPEVEENPEEAPEDGAEITPDDEIEGDTESSDTETTE